MAGLKGSNELKICDGCLISLNKSFVIISRLASSLSRPVAVKASEYDKFGKIILRHRF